MSSNRSLVPNETNTKLNFKNQVMEKEGYHVDPKHPNQVKYEVADEVGVPLKKGYNGNLTSKEAGKVGGNMGGPMVRELVKLAQQALNHKS